MIIAVYAISALFILLAAALLFAYYRSRHLGLLLIAITYAAAAALALMIKDWWPLALGFVSAWVLRLMGLDPTVRAPNEK